MKRWISLALAGAVGLAPVLAAGGAQAYFMSGEDLNTFRALTAYQHGQKADRFDAGMCVGFAVAMADVLMSQKSICVPGGVSSDTLAEVVALFIDQNPAMRQEQGGSIAWSALAKAYPCQGNAQ